MTEALAIEITRTNPGEWRVVERTHRTTESAYRVSFEPEELSALVEEIAVRLGSIGNGDDGDNIRLAHLGSRLSEMTLPPLLRQKLATQSCQVELFLDDHSVTLPVELFPNQGSVLADNIPVIRHWFCESACSGRAASGKETRQALIVADPAGNLPGARKEGGVVQRRFGRRKDWKCSYLSRSVTAEQLEWDLPTADVLHLAAHYEAGTANEQSGIVMANKRWLPSSASPAPELVFANCCRAGLPSDVGGDLSLAGHFLKHGARHVIAPFLPVSDESALKFASAFYAALDRNVDVANAVLSARKELGPAGWMYWHFGSTSRETIQEPPIHAATKKRSFGWVLFILVLVLAAATPWMKEVDTGSTSNSEPLVITERSSPDSGHLSEQTTGESAETIAPALDPIETSEATSHEPAALITEGTARVANLQAPLATGEAASESGPLARSKSSAAPSGPMTPQPLSEQLTAEKPAKPEISKENPQTPSTGDNSEIGGSTPVPEVQTIGSSTATGISSTVPTTDTTSIADSLPDKPESEAPAVLEQPQPIPETLPPVKPGLFAEALAEVDHQQSFEQAAIQVLEGYPEKYLKAEVMGKPDYNATTDKASVLVEVAIDNAQYRAMAQRLSETLKKFGHDGEHISATMERPYDSYMEIRYRFAGRKKYRDLLFLCIRANDSLTLSEWEFHSLPRSSIDAILSSISMPLLSVELTDSSGYTVASTSQKIPRPFLATEDRGFSILPAFNGQRSEMTMTSVIPGRNRLEIKLEFDLSPNELKQITDTVCTIKKGTRLPDEFTYRFLK